MWTINPKALNWKHKRCSAAAGSAAAPRIVLAGWGCLQSKQLMSRWRQFKAKLFKNKKQSTYQNPNKLFFPSILFGPSNVALAYSFTATTSPPSLFHMDTTTQSGKLGLIRPNCVRNKNREITDFSTSLNFNANTSECLDMTFLMPIELSCPLLSL